MEMDADGVELGEALTLGESETEGDLESSLLTLADAETL